MSHGKTDMSQIEFQDDAPVDEVDEQLVAYLDGELAPEDLRELEKRLGAEPALRARLRELQNGWEMLDELPQATSSGSLLETTIRMAAVNGDMATKAVDNQSKKRNVVRVIYVSAAGLACFLIGLAAMRVREQMRYQRQLEDLSIAMHLHAYLHASDLALMRNLAGMAQWQEANEIADTLGEWNFELAHQIDETPTESRETLLVSLPIEDQKTISANWERFEKISPKDKQTVIDVARMVSSQADSQDLIKTMDRFAAWRESLPAVERDLFANGTAAQREKLVMTALKRTTQNWMRERGRELSDEDLETIYDAVRQIASLRIDLIRKNSTPAMRAAITTFELTGQSMDQRAQGYFLRKLFEIPDDGPPRRTNDSNFAPRSPSPSAPPFAVGGGQNAFFNMREIVDQIRGPFRDDELYLLESVLPQNLTEMIDDTAALPMLREELLRSWASEAIRRSRSNRGKQTIVERYKETAQDEREEIDLLPSDRMLQSLQGEGEGRR